MGTPFISLLEPTPLPWERALPPSEQPHAASLPRTFLDAMTVRSQVFVQEQNIPQANEFDADDPRCAHWVIYASVNQTVSPAVTDAATGAVLRPRQSETQSVPIGTVRLVPFPHPPHPLRGGVYVDGELVSSSSSPAPEDTTTATANGTTQPTFTPDRPTTFHDGIEPYVKLGRLAVTKEFRGRGIAGQLVRTAVDWMRTHPSYFDPSPAERGFEQLGMEHGGTLPRWNGLLCCHAQEDAVKVWEKCGFQIDPEMGTWMEEGIPHFGMFLRVEVEPEAKGV
ncbi:acyl-CoA N-acyltransferase [Parachaetomium inaequale]|uniref:Glucosamine 6-phosphate N-acetyltransferase n=1 Tax=Parachaetomium inaequale TaxID=2588326 RepID=A0AAN6SPT3_9PEZI|nr:acyl-CoA N-acyltransferase [Parachaetomium inaequale]